METIETKIHITKADNMNSFTTITDVLKSIDLLLYTRGLKLLVGENKDGIYFLGIENVRI